LQELILLIFEAFGIEDRAVKDVRLRAYDALMKVRLGFFDKYEQSLLQVKDLHARSTIDLEIRGADGEFEVYDPNWIHLRACKFDAELSQDPGDPETLTNAVVVKFDKTKDRVQDLETQICE